MKSLYEYLNYREYLKDHYAHSKKLNPRFSFRYFSRAAGFSSSSFLKQVMEGQRNLSVNGIAKFSKALKLNKEESHFFKNLVLLNQATSVEERCLHAQEILRSKTFKRMNPIRDSQLRYLSEWYYIPIREMVALSDFREDPSWISQKLNPEIEPAEAEKALQEMQKIGLLTRNEEGQLVQSQSDVFVPDQITTSHLAQGHRNLIQKASESIDRFPSTERDISAVTVKLSLEGLNRIRELAQNFRNDLRAEAARDTEPDAIYQVTLQIFPLTQVPKKGSK